MSFPHWPDLKTPLTAWSAAPAPPARAEPAGLAFERDIVLIVRGVVICILAYFLFFSNLIGDSRSDFNDALRLTQAAFVIYTAVSVGTTLLLLGGRDLGAANTESVVFGVALLDACFLAVIVAITDGVDSLLYWLYPFLIVRNCVSVPSPGPQITLNLLCIAAFAGAAIGGAVVNTEGPLPDDEADLFAIAARLGRPFYLRLVLLGALTLWCFGLQALLARQRRALEEQRELALRRDQLAASGRLAAEIAHQLKNPLAIINTASYTLQKTVTEGKRITQQLQIIREEVEKSDRLITELMGYSQLIEGRVEKLDLREEIESAIQRVFPPAVKYEVQIHRDYTPGLPHLLAQKSHLQDVFVNILQNARDVMRGRGNIWISTRQADGDSVLVCFEDDGPGIPADLRERIFEPYFTTREKGTGLGLAIVKHNVEMYGGRVWVESEPGKGARFLLQFPARTLMRLRQ